MEHQTTATAPLAARAPRRLHRDPERRLIQGVAAGIAEHLGVRVAAVRAAFVILLPLNGVGALLYVAFWVVLRDPPGAGPPRRRNLGELLPYVALGAGVLLLWALAGFGGFGNALGWLIAMIAVGAGLIWHMADPERRRRWSRSVPLVPWMGAFIDEHDRRCYLLRFIGGGALVIVGIIGTIAVFAPISGNGFAALLPSILFALIALGGVALVLAPLLWRMFGQLREERDGPHPGAERAELAAMVHDQVLHTLALIQRNASDAEDRAAAGPRSGTQPAQLALQADRRRVRDVRGRDRAGGRRGRGHLRDRGRVGRRRRRGAGRRRCARWWTRPARRWSTRPGTRRWRPSRSTPRWKTTSVSVFVRDRGVGFDMSTVDDDRHGVRGSIIGRMERHGGRPRSGPNTGEGTEVRLSMPWRRHRRSEVMTELEAICCGMAAPGASGHECRSRRLRVFLVDDHAMFRAGVRSELGAYVDVVGEASTVAQAVTAIAATQPDVVLLDVHMPDGGGRAVLEAFRTRASRT